MSWKKYFKTVDTTGKLSPVSGATSSKGGNFAFRNYQSKLPEVYSGHPNRIERYNQYESMDADSEINACLDIIAEFCTQISKQNNTAFNFDFKEKPTDNEIKILKEQLHQWVKINQFDKRIFKLFRNTIKYGDQVFLRDPETFEMFWIDMSKVSRVIVNESDGKAPEQYVILDINPNFENLSVAQKTTEDMVYTPTGGGYNNATNSMSSTQAQNQTTGRFSQNIKETTVDAKHIVHLSLTEGLDFIWPFGQSVLENIFKVYKQKELLEDAVLIYRIQRAPERRVFYIDVGNMPSHMAMSFVERVKNEIHQRRIPTQAGGGQNMLDATYNPLCIDLKTKIPLLDGRTLKLNEIIAEYKNNKENWVYSADLASGKVVPGKIKWAGETRKNAEVLKIHLDNGETLTCTPDHKIPVLGKRFVEAKDLITDESLISLGKNSKGIKDEEEFRTSELVYNHKVVKIEYLAEIMNTGCLNVDNEHHTFAIESGIFIKNSTNEDYFFPQTSEGRGSKVDTLPGGENLGQIDDLKYFNNKLARGLRVPSSYLPTGPDENSNPISDGRVGTALIQENRFNEYCKRLQNTIIPALNKEFKMFLAFRGFNIDAGLFDLQFNPPQNFASYRESELDATRISSFTGLEAFPYLSKRFLLQRYLGLSEEEMQENEKLWKEENAAEEKISPAGGDLRGVGIMPGDMEGDIAMSDEFAGMEEMGGEEGEMGPLPKPVSPAPGAPGTV
jgi:hypothetical protein